VRDLIGRENKNENDKKENSVEVLEKRKALFEQVIAKKYFIEHIGV
jgi:hypothetical protein